MKSKDKFSYKDIPVTIERDQYEKESKQHLPQDFAVLCEEGIDRIIKERFIPWLLGTQFADRDPERVFDGIKVYDIYYHFGRMIAEYSPTHEEGYFGQFEFSFESSSEYTQDILEAVAMEVYVLDGRIVRVSGYEV